ncbi:MAG: serine/threonine-protein kinase [bacterium]|nr:serine/threonine protein kinase [Myxococcales bacterium]
MVRCAFCDAELSSGASWCLDCGHAVEPSGAGAATVPDEALSRFAGLALEEATMLDPGASLGPTALLRKARVSAGGGALPDEVSRATADTADPPPAPAPPVARPDSGPLPPPVPLPQSAPPFTSASSTPAQPAPVREGDVPQPGEVIDGYRIEAEIGRGGMGRVYRAVHAVTGQAVALKMLKPQVASDRVRERFINEARVLARLDHDNLVPLLGFVDAPRGLFIVMPFVRGITLEQMLRRQGRLAPAVAADLFSGIAAGVAHVHAHGMLHRDLKPGNIIVQSDGVPRLTDFGIAREIGAQGLTATGMVIGTAEYIAPEQANGTVRDDPRSDQYSLACILYEMLVGQPPFRHPAVGKLLIKHIQDPPPPPRTIVPEIPEALEAVVLTGLAKSPTGRFADVAAFAAAVRDAVGGGEFRTVPGEALAAAASGAVAASGAMLAASAPQVSSAQRAAPPPTRVRWLYIGLGLALSYAAVAGLWWWLSSQ